jgi:hypothetical protein
LTKCAAKSAKRGEAFWTHEVRPEGVSEEQSDERINPSGRANLKINTQNQRSDISQQTMQLK